MLKTTDTVKFEQESVQAGKEAAKCTELPTAGNDSAGAAAEVENLRAALMDNVRKRALSEVDDKGEKLAPAEQRNPTERTQTMQLVLPDSAQSETDGLRHEMMNKMFLRAHSDIEELEEPTVRRRRDPPDDEAVATVATVFSADEQVENLREEILARLRRNATEEEEREQKEARDTMAELKVLIHSNVESRAEIP